MRELSFLEAVDLIRATPEERAIPFGENEELHYEQVRNAIKQYAADQQQSQQTEKPRIGSKDNDAKKATAFLREVRPLLDEEGKKTALLLKTLVEQGTYNQLADHLNRLARRHKKTPLPTIEIVEQLDTLAARYNRPHESDPSLQTPVATADIILSETFIPQTLKTLSI